MPKKVIEFSKEELQAFLDDPNSCVKIIQSEYSLVLYPYHLNDFNSSVKEILNSRIAKYEKKLDGILLGYKNVKLLNNEGTIVADSCYVHLNINAEFYIFKPEIGSSLIGIVNKQSEGHVGCLVHRVFNVTVPRAENDEEWPGHLMELGQNVVLNVTNINLEARLPYIRGEFDMNYITIPSSSKQKKKKVDQNLNNDNEDIECTPVHKIKKHKVNMNKLINSIEEDGQMNSPKEKKKKRKSRDNTVDTSDLIEEPKFEEKAKKKRKSKEAVTIDTEISLQTKFDPVEKKKKKDKRKSKENDESKEGWSKLNDDKEGTCNKSLDVSTDLNGYKENASETEENNLYPRKEKKKKCKRKSKEKELREDDDWSKLNHSKGHLSNKSLDMSYDLKEQKGNTKSKKNISELLNNNNEESPKKNKRKSNIVEQLITSNQFTTPTSIKHAERESESRKKHKNNSFTSISVMADYEDRKHKKKSNSFSFDHTNFKDVDLNLHDSDLEKLIDESVRTKKIEKSSPLNSSKKSKADKHKKQNKSYEQQTESVLHNKHEIIADKIEKHKDKKAKNEDYEEKKHKRKSDPEISNLYNAENRKEKKRKKRSSEINDSHSEEPKHKKRKYGDESLIDDDVKKSKKHRT